MVTSITQKLSRSFDYRIFRWIRYQLACRNWNNQYPRSPDTVMLLHNPEVYAAQRTAWEEQVHHHHQHKPKKKHYGL